LFAIDTNAACTLPLSATRGVHDHGDQYAAHVTDFAHGATDATAAPAIHTITSAELTDALRLGWQDFKAVPSRATR